MMPVRGAWSVGLACAVVGLAGCSSGHGPPRSRPPDAYALDVTAAGRVRWQVPLPLPAIESGRVSPLAVGPVAVFAQRDVLYGLRLSDGHQVWSRALSGDTAGEVISGMWRWQGMVIVLTDGVVLAGLDASTGRIRWTRFIAGGVDGSYPTADGGLAMLTGDDDTLEVVDLSTGRVRWTRPAGSPADSGQSFPPPMAVAGGAVLDAVNGRLTSYADRTGHIRWTAAPSGIRLATALGELSLQAGTGVVYLTGVVQQRATGQPRQEMLGISAADGRVKWQFVLSPADALTSYAHGLICVTASSGSSWQDELDPATGRVRWQVASACNVVATPAGVVTAPGPDDTGQVSLHDTLTGQTLWTVRLAGMNFGWRQQAQALPVFPAGPLLVVPAAGLTGPDLLTALRLSDGHRAWHVTIPEPVAAPPLAVPGGILIYSADLRLLP